MPTVMLSHALYQDGMQLLQKNADVVVANSSDMSAVLADLQKADGLILRVGRIDRDIIDACPNLKVISRPGVGVDSVDVAAATEKGIPVVIAPGANARSVAEHAVALAYSICKNVVDSHLETAKGNFGIRNKYMAIEFQDSHLALIGFGNIGRMTANLFAAHGMVVHVYDPFVKQEAVEEAGYLYHSNLEDCLSASDVISLHMPSTPETKGMFGAKQFEAMKKGAFLVNCARGDIVDEALLYEALKSGQLAGAAVDVLESEPMDPESPLFSLPNFIATPHMAALTQQGAARTSVLTVEGTLAVLNGEQWGFVANPEAYKHPKWNK